MATDSQMSNGVVEGCVLRLLKDDYRYSGEIVALMRANGFTDFSEGTLYPLLLRLEKAGYFDTLRQATNNSPPKKYYKLSAEGRERLKNFENMWLDLVLSVNNIFNTPGSRENSRTDDNNTGETDNNEA